MGSIVSRHDESAGGGHIDGLDYNRFRRATRLRWREWPIKQACLTGAIGLGFGTVLMNFGFLYSNPVNVAVIATTVPVVSVIMGMFQGEERLTLRIGIALCFALAGGVLVSISSLETEVGFQGGELLMVIAVVLYTWFSRVSAKQLRVIPASRARH